MKASRRPERSSSSSFDSNRTDSNRTEPTRREKTEEDNVFDRRRASLPVGAWPDPGLRHYPDERSLFDVMAGRFGLPLPDAIDLVAEHGIEACEGAVVKTLAHQRAGGRIRTPRGWLIATLRKGQGWSAAQVEVYLDSLLEEVVKGMAESENETDRRLARELERAWGQTPEKVIDFPEARAQ